VVQKLGQSRPTQLEICRERDARYPCHAPKILRSITNCPT
jgi:hypothetical protein